MSIISKLKIKSTRYPVYVEIDIEIIKDLEQVIGIDSSEELANIIQAELLAKEISYKEQNNDL